MTKHCVLWRPFLDQSFRGEEYGNVLPELVAQAYRGSLISEILRMPLGTPISFNMAIRMTSHQMRDAFENGKIGYERGENSWYRENFIQFISESGFHIELSGDEFGIPFGPTTNC